MARGSRGVGRNAEYAAETWKILVETAANHQSINSGDVSARLGRPVPRGIGAILDHVGDYCHDEGLPHLTVLAINKERRQPGEGWQRSHPGVAPEDTRDRVFRYDWSAIPAPTPEQLADAYRRHRR